MSDDHRFTTDVDMLLRRAIDQQLDEPQLAKLELLLRSDRDALEYYIDHVVLHAMLQCEQAPPLVVAREAERDSEVRTTAGYVVKPALISPLSFLGSTIDNGIGFLSSGWPVAYLIATVILAVGAIIGASIHVSRPTQVVFESHRAANDRMTAVDTTQQVGRITGMVDCTWAGTDRVSREVALGATYKLVSGLAEITYNTGARVILQGPVTFEVDSADGGFLSFGKLTARVEKDSRSKIQGSRAEEAGSHQGTGSREQGTEVSDDIPASAVRHSPSPGPRSLAPSPLFSVRTPTATIADLGTEFGVEVKDNGDTTSHVFRGSVEVYVVGADPKTEITCRVLHENESAYVANSHDALGGCPQITVSRQASEVAGFVREIHGRVPSPRLAHLWTFDSTGDDSVGGAEYALAFSGSATCDTSESRIGVGSLSGLTAAEDYARVKTYFAPDAKFTISAWIKTTSGGNNHTVFAWGQRDGNRLSRQFRIGQDPYAGQLLYGQSGPGETWHRVCTGDNELNDDVWHHIAVVRVQHMAALYVDGATRHEWTSYLLGGEPPTGEVTLGGMTFQSYPFCGRIDDVGYWPTALGTSQIRAIWELGSHPALQYGQKDVAALFQLYADGQGEAVCGKWRWTVCSELPKGEPGSLINRGDDVFSLYLDANAGLSGSPDRGIPQPKQQGDAMTP